MQVTFPLDNFYVAGLLCMDTFYAYVMLLCYATDSMWSYVHKISSLCWQLIISPPPPQSQSFSCWLCYMYYFHTIPHLTSFFVFVFASELCQVRPCLYWMYPHSGGWLSSTCPHNVTYAVKFLLRAQPMQHIPTVNIMDIVNIIPQLGLNALAPDRFQPEKGRNSYLKT